MATASDYLKYNNPINAPADPSRGFSDKIYIDFTQGKKSLDDQLKEIDLANKQLALEQQKLMPTDAALQEFGWSKAAADRAAEQAIFDRSMAEAENKRQQQASRQSRKEFKFSKRMSKEDLALKQASDARSAEAAALTAQVTQQQLAQEAELFPYKLQQAQADINKTNQATSASSLASNEAAKKANPPLPSFQYYSPPANPTAVQQQWAHESINNPNWYVGKPILSTNAASTAQGLGSYYSPTQKKYVYA